MKTPYLLLKIEDEKDLKLEVRKKRDEFLDVYSFYLQARVSMIKDEVNLKAYELHILDPSFNFKI